MGTAAPSLSIIATTRKASPGLSQGPMVTVSHPSSLPASPMITLAGPCQEWGWDFRTVLRQGLAIGLELWWGSPCDLQTHFTWGVKSARQIWLGVIQQGLDSEQPGLTPNTGTNQGRQGQTDRSLLGQTMARYQVSCCSSPVTTHLG